MRFRQTLGDLSVGHANNFDFLRVLFAVLVILSHSYAFSSQKWFPEPLMLLQGIFLRQSLSLKAW